jgi:hypothetical protein
MEIKSVKPILVLLTIMVLALGSPGRALITGSTASPEDALGLPEEKHLKNIKQLSFAGENAESYFSDNCRQLIFQ